MIRSRQLVLAAVLLAAISALALPRALARTQATPGAAPAGALKASVSIVNSGGSCTNEFCFSPSTVTVNQAGTVTWTNKSTASHTVTRCTSAACPGAGPGTGTDPAFNSGIVAAGKTFSVTFHAAGTYNYYCQIHGFAVMHGTVTVLPFGVKTSKLAGGSVGTAYSATLKTAGGESPYHWSLVTGALPKGLKLGTSGEISGTPSASGKSTFTLKVTDSSSPALSASKSLSISIT